MSEEQLIPTPGVFGETGNFLLEREMGRGGMGGVYMGRDKMLDRPVAVKVMLKEYGADAEFVEKFKREAQAAARLIHPNIAQVYSYGIAEGMPYIAMELVAGGSLDQLMKNAGASIDITRVMKIGEQVAQALRCAADQGVVHGDVKPENVLLDANGNAKLVDFGLAAMQKNTNEIWGTPYYIAPEKVKKEAVDFRADMYSLGGTLYHALTGVAPFEGEDAAAVVRKRLQGPPVAPSRVRKDVSPQIDAMILKMLALNPADRYPSFEALLEEFRRVMTSGLTAASPAGTSAPGGRKVIMKKRFKVKTHEAGEGAETSGDERPSRKYEPPPAEESGGVAGKVFGVIGLTIAAIGLVAGLLVWYVIADQKARAREKQEQIASNISKARKAIVDIKENAVKFAAEVDVLAAKSQDECQKPTGELRRLLSEHFDSDRIAGLKPEPSAELAAAIALTNIVVAAEGGDTNAVAATDAPAAEGAASAPAPAASAPAAAIPKFRPPTDDEADPASPEHEEYLKAKAAWEKEQKEKAAREASAPKPAPAAEPASAPASAPAEAPAAGGPVGNADLNEALSIAKRDMGDLWDRAYSCLAASIRLRHKINQLVAKVEEVKIEGDDEATMRRAADISNQLRDEFDQIKASDDVAKVQKAASYIKSKGSKTVEQTVNRIKVALLKIERAKKAAEEAERAKRAAEEAERKKNETIAEDNRRIAEKFDRLVESGVFRQLDWASAVRQLEALRDEFKYSESQIVADGIILKVKMMARVQDVFIANCKGYVFGKFKLARHKIVEINEREIKLLKPDGKTPMKMTWVRFYQNFHGNLNELIIKFIEKGKDSSRLKDGKRLSLQPWAEAMMGAALTMRIICSDGTGADLRAVQIAQNAVKAYPDYLKHAKAIFPDVEFEVSAAE